MKKFVAKVGSIDGLIESKSDAKGYYKLDYCDVLKSTNSTYLDEYNQYLTTNNNHHYFSFHHGQKNKNMQHIKLANK